VATEAKKLQVGGFVLTAIVLALVASIWIGSVHLFTKTVTVATYLEASAAGLDAGAPVKYRGVPVGKVAAVQIAPDGKLIEVLMTLEEPHADRLLEDPTLRARIELVGITGVRFVEIEPAEGARLDEHPELTFTPAWPVIPSAPSTLDTLQSALDRAFGSVGELDLAGISGDLRTTLRRVNGILADPRVDATLTNIEATSRSASLIAEDLREVSGSASLKRTVHNLEGATAEARDLLADLQRGKAGEDLRGALAGVARLGDRVDEALHDVQDAVTRLGEDGRGVLGDLALTVERLDVAIGDIEGVTRGVREQPSLLLFAEQPDAREPGTGWKR
jgi:ABC-type transporter Mla subunit MlaD